MMHIDRCEAIENVSLIFVMEIALKTCVCTIKTVSKLHLVVVQGYLALVPNMQRSCVYESMIRTTLIQWSCLAASSLRECRDVGEFDV